MEISFGGQTSPATEQGTLSLSVSCPSSGEARTLNYSASPEGFTLYQTFDQPVDGTLVLTFGERP